MSFPYVMKGNPYLLPSDSFYLLFERLWNFAVHLSNRNLLHIFIAMIDTVLEKNKDAKFRIHVGEPGPGDNLMPVFRVLTVIGHRRPRSPHNVGSWQKLEVFCFKGWPTSQLRPSQMQFSTHLHIATTTSNCRRRRCPRKCCKFDSSPYPIG